MADKDNIEVALEALGINIEHALVGVKGLLLAILIIGIVALVHFW